MPSQDDITACGLIVRPHEHSVVAQGHELNLTSREFEIIAKLARHPGWVFSAVQLSTDDDEADYSPESVSVLMTRVRRKLARVGAANLIETVRGFGYRLRVPARDGDELAETGAYLCNALRDSCWYLQEAVLEVEHSGSEEQRQAAVNALENARRAIYGALAE